MKDDEELSLEQQIARNTERLDKLANLGWTILTGVLIALVVHILIEVI